MDSEILESLEEAESKAKSLIESAQAKAKEILANSEDKAKSLIAQAENSAHEKGKLMVSQAARQSEKAILEANSAADAIRKKTQETADKNIAKMTQDLCKKVYQTWPS